MKWYYESNGHPQGPILENELRKLREEGKITADCLIWREGMEDWAPFEKVREFGSASQTANVATGLQPLSLHKAPPTPLQADSVAGPENAPTPSPPGFQLSEPEANPGLRADAPAADAASVGNEQLWAPRWECPGPGGPLLELLPSTVEILFSPASVFTRLRKNGGWGMPLAFLALLNAIGTVMVLWTVEQLPATGSVFSKIIHLAQKQDVSAAMLLATLIGSTLILPLTAVFKSGVLHVLMRLGAGSKAAFPTTFRAACYAMGASSALWIVPLGAVWASSFSGQPLVVEAAMLLSAGATGVWSMVVLLQALSRSHGVPLWRTAIAILLPPFIISILLGIALASGATHS
jgi:hypothetical protein